MSESSNCWEIDHDNLLMLQKVVYTVFSEMHSSNSQFPQSQESLKTLVYKIDSPNCSVLDWSCDCIVPLTELKRSWMLYIWILISPLTKY